MCVCAYVSVCVCHGTHVEVRGQSQVLVLSILCEAVPFACCVHQVSWPLNFFCLLSVHRNTGIMDTCCHVQLYVGSRDSNYSPCACVVSPSPTEVSISFAPIAIL